ERKGFEARLLQAAEQLWKANQELEQFAYVSSHDLQEPLRKISVYSQMLSQKLPQQDPAVSKCVEAISSSVYRMQQLIDDILNYSRVSRDDQALQESVDLNKVLARVLSDLELSIQDKKAVITVEELPTINAHPTKMYQLFQNLIRNALKFHSDQLPRIHVKA